MFPCPPAYLPVADSQFGLVEVFRTDLFTLTQTATVRRTLHARFPALRVAFDLDDCDRVLRVQSPYPAGPGLWAAVADTVRGLGVAVELLPD